MKIVHEIAVVETSPDSKCQAAMPRRDQFSMQGRVG